MRTDATCLAILALVVTTNALPVDQGEQDPVLGILEHVQTEAETGAGLMQAASGLLFAHVGDGFCRGPKVSDSVNCRIKSGLADQEACAAACASKSECTGFAFVSDGYAKGECAVYGEGLDEGLPPFEAFGMAKIEWVGFSASNSQIGARVVADPSTKCYRRSFKLMDSPKGACRHRSVTDKGRNGQQFEKLKVDATECRNECASKAECKAFEIWPEKPHCELWNVEPLYTDDTKWSAEFECYKKMPSQVGPPGPPAPTYPPIIVPTYCTECAEAASFTLVGQGFCRGPEGVFQLVNGRIKAGLANQADCQAQCASLSECAGYAFVDAGIAKGECAVYGEKLDQGLNPWENFGKAVYEWVGFTVDNSDIGDQVQFDPSTKCFRKTAPSNPEWSNGQWCKLNPILIESRSCSYYNNDPDMCDKSWKAEHHHGTGLVKRCKMQQGKCKIDKTTGCTKCNLAC